MVQAREINLADLLRFEPEEGLIWLKDYRMVMLSACAPASSESAGQRSGASSRRSVRIYRLAPEPPECPSTVLPEDVSFLRGEE